MISIQCKEVIDKNCDFIAYGSDSEEVVEKMLEHWKESHSKKINSKVKEEKLHYMIHYHY